MKSLNYYDTSLNLRYDKDFSKSTSANRIPLSESINMHINLSKTSVMAIGTRQNRKNSDLINIYLNDEILQKTDTQRLLGITIDKTLSWDFQIDSICLNIARRITLMKQLSKYVNKESLKQYYISYVLPNFDYGCIIWSRCSVANTNRLLKLSVMALSYERPSPFIPTHQVVFVPTVQRRSFCWSSSLFVRRWFQMCCLFCLCMFSFFLL